MIARFDSFNRFEPPKMFVCNPGCTYSSVSGLLSSVRGALSGTSDEELVARFNEESELNFRIYLPPQDGESETAERIRLYKSLKNRRMLFVEDVGFFVITEVKDGFDDNAHFKDVRAFSCEVEIENKNVPFIEDGTYSFVDLLEDIVEVVPLWTIGHVDTSVAARYRTFEDVSTDLNCLGFLQENMQDAYECIFVYDIVNRTISAYDQSNYVRDTYIHITEDDLIQSMEVSENSDDLYTAITAQGDEELNISPVNPLGTNTIYNFDYYIDWMSDTLGAKVAAWQALVKSKESDYYDLNLAYYTALETKSDINAEIDAINTQLTMYRRCRDNIVAEDGTADAQSHTMTQSMSELVNEYNSVIVDSGGTAIGTYDGIGATLDAIDALIDDAEGDLATQESALTSINATIAGLQTQIDAIHSTVSMSGYFTSAELTELNNYIFEGQYTDEYITVTDSMGYDDKFAQMKILYDRSVERLERISQPTQEYSVDVGNFIFVKEFEPWSEQLETGCLINVELERDDVAMLFLTELAVNYDDESLKLTFGNRFTKFSPKSLYDDVLGSVRKSANTLSYISEILYPIKDGEFNQMKEALENSRNLTKNAVLSSANEEVLIDDTGYTGRRRLSNGNIDPKQIKINGRNIVFTDDAWETARTAIGELILANQQTAYGVNAEVLLGDFIVGNNLRILNSDGDDMFVVTESNVRNSLNENEIKALFSITDSISSSVSSAQSDIDTLSSNFEQTAAGFTASINTLNTEVSNANDEITGFKGTVENYITFDTNGLTLGKSDSEIKLVITNDSIGIYYGDTAVTTWDTSALNSPLLLNIPNGGQLTIGNFSFVPRDNGSLDFTWIGG